MSKPALALVLRVALVFDGAFVLFPGVVQEPQDADAEERDEYLLGQGARRALFYNPRLAREERGAFRERRRLGGVFRRGAVVARGRRLREREELAPLDALRHLDLDAVGAGHDRARRARRHDPGDRLLRPVLRGVDGRGRPLDQESIAAKSQQPQQKRARQRPRRAAFSFH